jgi:hypothetical protein
MEEVGITILYCSSIPTKGKVGIQDLDRRNVFLKGIGFHFQSELYIVGNGPQKAGDTNVA